MNSQLTSVTLTLQITELQATVSDYNGDEDLLISRVYVPEVLSEAINQSTERQVALGRRYNLSCESRNIF